MLTRVFGGEKREIKPKRKLKVIFCHTMVGKNHENIYYHNSYLLVSLDRSWGIDHRKIMEMGEKCMIKMDHHT